MNGQQSTAETVVAPAVPIFTSKCDGSRATLSYTNSVHPSQNLCSTPALPAPSEPQLSTSVSSKFAQGQSIQFTYKWQCDLGDLSRARDLSESQCCLSFSSSMLNGFLDTRNYGWTMWRTSRIGKPLSIILLLFWLFVSWISPLWISYLNSNVSY